MDLTYTIASVDAKTELVNSLKTELPKFGYATVKVIPSDPQNAAEMPCVGINRIDDSETSQSIADAQGTSYDTTTKTYYDYKGTFFSETLEIRVWHTNADERDALYQVVKGIVFAIRPDLVGKGLLNFNLRSGRDEQDSTMQNAPQVLYWSTITMSYLNPLNVEYTEIIAPISAITNNGVLTATSP